MDLLESFAGQPTNALNGAPDSRKLIEENETLRDENQHLRELFADALARIRELEEAERDGDEASSAGAASEESVPAESDSEDDLPLAALRRRLAARDDDASESEEEDASESEEDASESEEEADARPRKRPRTTAAPRMRERTSKYYGVSIEQRTGRFQVRYRDATGKSRSAGAYDDEEDAAHGYNAAIRAHGLESVRPINAVDDQGGLVAKPKNIGSSVFYGVSWSTRDGKWRAVMKAVLFGGTKSLGCFDDETAAARAVDAYLYEHHPDIAAKKANFPRA